jgi:hypothetical protein
MITKNTQYWYTFQFWPELFTHQSNTSPTAYITISLLRPLTVNTKEQCVCLHKIKNKPPKFLPLLYINVNKVSPHFKPKINYPNYFWTKIKIIDRNIISRVRSKQWPLANYETKSSLHVSGNKTVCSKSTLWRSKGLKMSCTAQRDELN